MPLTGTFSLRLLKLRCNRCRRLIISAAFSLVGIATRFVSSGLLGTTQVLMAFSTEANLVVSVSLTTSRQERSTPLRTSEICVVVSPLLTLMYTMATEQKKLFASLTIQASFSSFPSIYTTMILERDREVSSSTSFTQELVLRTTWL